jgi:solute carrier family 8 (sodium/calcium exchanger)
MGDLVPPGICEPGGSGIFLPLFPTAELEWPTGLRATLYLVGLLWTFLGVAIVADVFMAAIEVITSREKAVKLPDGSTVKVKIWNATVANLTLMALGSSAPEILMSVIEITLSETPYYAGELGPGTIVGSAAFNMLVIIAVCMVAIPPPGGRKIDDLAVFGVTATFSIFAYLWLLVILSVSSPNVVTVTEALLTFIFFPVLVWISYLADIKFFSERKIVPSHIVRLGGVITKVSTSS